MSKFSTFADICIYRANSAMKATRVLGRFPCFVL